MLIKTILKETVSLQGFKIISTTKTDKIIRVHLAPDKRHHHLCGRCLKPGRFHDIRPQRTFKHVPLWNIAVELLNGTAKWTKWDRLSIHSYCQ